VKARLKTYGGPRPDCVRRNAVGEPRTIAIAAVLLWVCAGAGIASAQSSADDFWRRLVAAATERTRHVVRYDGSYRRIPYPGGDVPDSIGVCTDLVIRSYRAVGIDLQKEVHLDMTREFSAYQDAWGLGAPDPNIDHRRVPNLRTFFERKADSRPISGNPQDYRPGDLVTWMLPGNLPHIGIVVDRRSTDGKRPCVAHNIGEGPKVEDVLFRYPLTGHYRYRGPPVQ
jgi:uncharacterized protein YijF (DUF1287 family)